MTVECNKVIPEMLTIREVSNRTGLAYGYIRQLCLNDEIVCRRAGKKWLVNYGKFIDYLNGENKN